MDNSEKNLAVPPMVPEENSGRGSECVPFETGAPPADFRVMEREVARRLGLPRKRLREYRDEWLEEGTDWRCVKKVPQWTQAAVDRVASRLAGESASVPVPPPARVVVKLISATNNPMIWLAQSGEDKVRVYLRPDERWHAGMEIDVRQGNQPKLYVYEGPLPRWKGKM